MRSGLILLLSVLLCSHVAAAPAPVFKAGAATANITPLLGGAIIGGFVPFPSKHVHDQLHARCLVLDDGQTRLAIVVCDLLGIHTNISNEARKRIEQAVGIPPQRVLISATHTHSASSALGQDRMRYDSPMEDYGLFVARRIADGVQCAVNNLRPAEIAFGTAESPEHVNCRRWFLEPGKMPPNPFGEIDQVKMNPGSANLVKPAGPTDPTVSFFSIREPEGRPIALYSCYSLHYVGGVGPAHISADYYGIYCRQLARLLGAERQEPAFVAMMANGTSGDINNISFRKPRPRQQPYEQMRFVAEDLAGKVHAAMAKLEYRKQVTLAASYREAAIKPRRPTEKQIAWAKAKAGDTEKAAKGDLPTIYAQRTLGLLKYPATVAVPLQVLRIGDVCLGTMPCEVLCEIGLEFKQRSPVKPAFLVSLAHGYMGYLPPPNQHDLGGYETWLGTNRLERNASVLMLDALMEMVGEVSGKKAAKK